MKPRQDPSTKPYYRCLSCSCFRRSCAGIPTRDMDMKNWCEYVRDVMDAFHLKSAYVAEKAETSTKTIERIRSVNFDQDIMRGTARRIEIVVFGPVGKHYCDLDCNDSAVTERINELLAEVAYWRKENDRKAKIIDKYLD